MITLENKKFFNNDGSEYKFDFENFIKNELGIGKKPERAAKKSEICQDFLRGICARTNCKYQHKVRKFIVCKHWLRGLCMKGEEQCEYLHEYDLTKVPKCVYYKLYGVCNSPNCVYSHNDIDCEKCDWYNHGFCRKGSTCHKKHVKQIVCQLYLTGFCPRGPYCPNGHPKMDLISKRREFSLLNKNVSKMMTLIEKGGDIQEGIRNKNHISLSYKDVTCFNCRRKGHFARNCFV
ncbi:hypothetical protein C1645_855948 [Glomus cerebriforme]|uniref:mRNA 3'-end-processing protein n=1 Tax=Glomus cerebriforme TaxID=658196 RepID=A0A397SLL6_9GLOM|nr:hypothetical protein C1645_855948 [Glomus cerebriforme]